MPDNPATQRSDEVDENQLRQSRTEGDAYLASATYVTTCVAEAGDTTEAGDYVVGFAQEAAEGTYELVDEGQFEFVEPDDENCHLEVVVADRGDGRFGPYCGVEARLEGADESVGPVDLPFLWHPGVYHYGTDLEIPGPGTYDVHVEVAPPTVRRHDEQNGDRYGEAVTVTFEDVAIDTGRDLPDE